MAKQKNPTCKSTLDLLIKFRQLYKLGPTPIIAQTIASLDRQYTALLDVELKNFMSSTGATVWWETIMLQYPIKERDGLFIVRSAACAWTKEKVWEFAHKFEAIEKIQELVQWLDVARDRGFGSRNKDINRIAQNVTLFMHP